MIHRFWSYSYGLTDDRLRLYYKDFALIPASPPSEADQERIAKLLDVWDAAIAKLDALRDAYDKRYAWLRAEVLSGARRLDGRTRDWTSFRLKELISEHGLKSTGQEDVFSVSVNKGLVNQLDHLGRSMSAVSTLNYNLVRPGDLVYTKSPTGRFPLGIVKLSTVKANVIVSPLYGVFTPINLHIGKLLDAYFASPEIATRYLAPLVQKGAKNTLSITNSRFLEGRIRLPADLAEQQELAEVVGAAKKQVMLSAERLQLLTLQKSGIMQRLLTTKGYLANHDDIGCSLRALYRRETVR